MSEQVYQADVVIAGGGLAGMVAAFELLDLGKSVIILERDPEEKFGGLAKESFGGVMLIDTPHQKRMGINDSPDLALRDWHSFAHFGPEDEWPRKWAEFYCHNADEYIYHFMDSKGITFLPLVNWPERGLNEPGNTVPRWHITWGTGYEIVSKMLAALETHPRRNKLQIFFEHEVKEIDIADAKATAFRGKDLKTDRHFRADGEHLIVASGGMCGGDLSKVRENWYKPWGDPPKKILNGSHRYADGQLHDVVLEAGGRVTHLDKQWHYAAGVHHPAQRKPDDGLSLVPPRSALWVNAEGRRIRNPAPLVGYTDTRHLVESICKEPGQYSWQVMNWKIAVKELAVSGSDYMTAFRNKSKVALIKSVLFGNKDLVERLIRECPDDIVTAQTVGELAGKMNEKNLYGLKTDPDLLESEIAEYDSQIERGPAYYNDEQLRRLVNMRSYKGDRIRLCKNQRIVDSKAMPLIAIREFILSRKSLGGIQTDLQCRVLSQTGEPIVGLYAVGEAAGFGGGGIHGLGSLEGTFLGSCVLTGRAAGRAIAGA